MFYIIVKHKMNHSIFTIGTWSLNFRIYSFKRFTHCTVWSVMECKSCSTALWSNVLILVFIRDTSKATRSRSLAIVSNGRFGRPSDRASLSSRLGFGQCKQMVLNSPIVNLGFRLEPFHSINNTYSNAVKSCLRS